METGAIIRPWLTELSGPGTASLVVFSKVHCRIIFRICSGIVVEHLGQKGTPVLMAVEAVVPVVAETGAAAHLQTGLRGSSPLAT